VINGKHEPRAVCGKATPDGAALPVILSFDVEWHDQIEAAAGLEVGPGARAEYARRAGERTR
jgi:hypothetical protein